jgi:hypothetical protein
MSSKRKIIKIAVVVPVLLIGLLACAHIAMMVGKPKPAASEFGYGPRKSANGSYSVTIEETAPYKTGKLLNSVIRVQDAAGKAVENATITVDGGMPQHGHGLPTKPRVTQGLGNGRYQVSGLKFNMGGWWELKFAIGAGAATDSVTFNLDL